LLWGRIRPLFKHNFYKLEIIEMFLEFECTN
jgi:hypothetical protein